MDWIFSGFGWGLWKTEDGKYVILNGEGDIVHTVASTFEGKKWMKENKTSEAWNAIGNWDWNRIRNL